MGLNRRTIGSFIEAIDERNSFGLRSFYGLDKSKSFIPTKALTGGLDESKYKVVRYRRFVFSGMQTGRDKCIRIGLSVKEDPFIVSPAYTTFEVVDPDVDPTYFFMRFQSSEMDRLGWFYSDGSIRSNLDWDVFCNIEIELPPIEVQRKYVAIYEAMLANQWAYEKGLDDLKLTCDALLDRCKESSTWEPVGKHLREVDVRNTSGKCDVAYGINIKKEFMLSKASSDDLLKYKLVEPGQLAYSAMQTGRDKCIRIALNESSSTLAVSPAYSILESVDAGVDARYVMMWFSRAESDRYGWFLSDASIRANLDLSSFLEIEMPIPESGLREALCDLYSVLRIRSSVNDHLKSQLKNICPILIRGSIEEASR